MVLIIKRFVKVFPNNADVPIQYKNLRKNKHVKTFSRPFPNIPDILVAEYNLTWDDKIIVFHTKEIECFKGWHNYRTPFKKVYYGTVRDFKAYLKEFLNRIKERELRKKMRKEMIKEMIKEKDRTKIKSYEIIQ